MIQKRKHNGFTLIEILLVVVIMGIMLSVIVPRAWRANIDSKYGLVRQAASETVSFAQQWGEQQLLAQEEDSSSNVGDYFTTLVGWVADQAGDTNWVGAGALVAIDGRNPVGGDAEPEVPVKAIIPPEKMPRNPFNGTSVFANANFPTADEPAIPGAMFCGAVQEGDATSPYYMAIIFQGTGSEGATSGVGPGCGATDATFYGGQAPDTLEGLRNGVFMGRT